MSRPIHVLALLALATTTTACDRAAEILNIPPPQGCQPRREIRYCVTAWPRDPWNERSRAAIGAAARAWNAVGPYELREVYCNYPHELPIFFEQGAHGDGHDQADFGTELAHASFPSSSHLFIHFKDTLAWWQAADTLWQGYDMQSVALHEIGHVFGLEHDDRGDSIMTPYVVRHAPLGADIARVQSYARRCGVDAPPPIEITEPGPGATWHRGGTYRVAWRAPTLEGHVVVHVTHDGQSWWRAWDAAPVSGQMDITVHDGWPLGCPYEVCIWHPTTGSICSSMILVAP